MSFAHFGVGSGDIMLDNVQCTGEELTLLDCPAITDHNCNHIEDAGVICGIYPLSSGQMPPGIHIAYIIFIC